MSRRMWTGAFYGLGLVVLAACGICGPVTAPQWKLSRSIEVEGRQGIASDGERYYVSGSTALFVHSKFGVLLAENRDPFKDLEKKANHIGDISVYRGELFAGIEWFVDGVGTNIQIAVYDTATLAYKRSIDWDPDSGQAEVSGVAVDAVNGCLWLTDWTDGKYVYRYGLESGAYEGRLEIRPPPRWQQGIAVSEGFLYITADDGDAEQDEPDSLWRAKADLEAPWVPVEHFMVFDDFQRAGEIEGIAFEPVTGDMLIHTNRGKRIVLGMPRGLYPGYDREIHEVYVFEWR